MVVTIAAAAVIVVVALVGVGLAVTNAALDQEADAAVQSASAAVAAAVADRDAALVELSAASDAAVAAHASATALLGVGVPGVLTSVAARDTLTAARDALDQGAELQIADDGTATAPPAPVSTPAPEIEIPDGREARLAAVDGIRALAEPIAAEAQQLRTTASTVTAATAAVTTAETGLIAAVHDRGAATTPPDLASQETKDAYAATVAALAAPAADADLAALVATVRDAWAAAIATAESAARAQDGADVQPTVIGGILIVNKTFGIPSSYGDGLTAETQAAFDAMQAEAASIGLNIYISSGFRSYASQQAIYSRYVAADGQAAADRYSARPGHSEHQTGLAFDLNSIDESFGATAEGQWVRDNAHRFGFIVRYPEGKEAVTGYIWEPWHLRYLGVDVATSVHESGLSLEEYLGVTSSYE